mgnify:CR=1 FL=1
MRLSSFGAQNDDSGAYMYGSRRGKKDDKIPFSPDVSNKECSLLELLSFIRGDRLR